jgi:anti-sigma factor RsiW
VTCASAGLAISKELDDELTPSASRALRAHLRGCAGCARDAEKQIEVRRALRSLGAAASAAGCLGAPGRTHAEPYVDCVTRLTRTSDSRAIGPDDARL